MDQSKEESENWRRSTNFSTQRVNLFLCSRNFKQLKRFFESEITKRQFLSDRKRSPTRQMAQELQTVGSYIFVRHKPAVTQNKNRSVFDYCESLIEGGVSTFLQRLWFLAPH
jgi:hypothetical protein